MGSDYILAWSCYVASSIALIAVLWQLLSHLGLRDAKTIICLMATAFLFTPVPLASGSSFWAPAFMAAAIDFLGSGTEAAVSRLWPMLITMFVAVLGSFGWQIYRSKRLQPAVSKN